MSGLLHPVGPEPARTYWLRRALVIGTLVVVVAIVVALLVNGGTGPRAIPAPPASVTPQASPSDNALQSPLPSPSPTETSAAPSATGSPSASPTNSSTAKTRKPTPHACDGSQLRTTLTGKKSLKLKEASTFDLSLINGSSQECVVSVTPQTFELKISSGRDRIWSSNDCATSVKAINKSLGSEKSLGWKMRWNGLRSANGCKSRTETPKAGTYIATARLDGAQPVQLRMILAG